MKVPLPYLPALDWKSLKSLDEVEWLKPDGKTRNEEENIIVGKWEVRQIILHSSLLKMFDVFGSNIIPLIGRKYRLTSHAT